MQVFHHPAGKPSAEVADAAKLDLEASRVIPFIDIQMCEVGEVVELYAEARLSSV